jgi:hypothetical protein
MLLQLLVRARMIEAMRPIPRGCRGWQLLESASGIASPRYNAAKLTDHAFAIVCDTFLRYKALFPDPRRTWYGPLSCLGTTHRAVGHG